MEVWEILIFEIRSTSELLKRFYKLLNFRQNAQQLWGLCERESRRRIKERHTKLTKSLKFDLAVTHVGFQLIWLTLQRSNNGVSSVGMCKRLNGYLTISLLSSSSLLLASIFQLLICPRQHQMKSINNSVIIFHLKHLIAIMIMNFFFNF